MNDAEARAWLQDTLHVPRETLELLNRFQDLLASEATRQNLIAASTFETLWGRHIVDSAQLLLHARANGRWIDLGTGAGFPGVVVAVLGGATEVVLVEARRKRIEFLTTAVTLLGLDRVARVFAGRAEQCDFPPFDTISARAFAPLERLFAIGSRFAGPATRWVLPKGRSAHAELEAARQTWQGEFRIEPSITDPHAAIIVAEQVRPRRQR